MRPFALPAVFVLITAGVAAASPVITTEYGIEFVTVGDAGNPHTTLADTVFGSPELHIPRGGVDYEFRIGRTEITTGQWFEFVEAYLPFHEPRVPGGGSEFTSSGIFLDFPSGQPVMVIPADRPASVGWQFAARYANWLHNDKVNEAWAFETGAYDTSTWEVGPNGEPPAAPQIFASPGARFRLPTPDEWIKTVYYDPNRRGPGEGGYWPYPYASATETVSTPPGLGGDSDVEAVFRPDDIYSYLPVGSYPHASAPWGALDVSGSLPELLEGTPELGGFIGLVVSQRYSTAFDADVLDLSLGFSSISNIGSSGISTGGFRLAATIPSPSSALLVVSVACLSTIRRKR